MTDIRLLLSVSVKLFSLIVLGTALYVLLSSINNGDAGQPEKPPVPQVFSLDEFSEGRAYHLASDRGNLILVRRSKETLVSLQHETEKLLDPLSLQARQPENLSPITRSERPELFIAFDRGTALGCPLRWIPPGSRETPVQPWSGGFRDSCDGSWYDAAGRVFKGQQAVRNLDIPPYRIHAKDLLEIGSYGDNPTPVN